MNIRCFWINVYKIYYLKDLQKKEKDYHKAFEHGEIIFNFCQNTVAHPLNTIVWTKNINTSLIKIAGTIDGDSDNKNEWTELNKEEEGGKTGLQIKLTHGEKCLDFYHQTFFKLYCDITIRDDKFLETVDLSEFYHNGDICTHYIKARSICGCYMTYWSLLRAILTQNNIFFFIIYFSIGIYICIFGTKYAKVTLIIAYLITLDCLTKSYFILINYTDPDAFYDFYVSFFIVEIAIVFLVFFFIISVDCPIHYVIPLNDLYSGILDNDPDNHDFNLRKKYKYYTIFLGIWMGYSFAEIVNHFLVDVFDWDLQKLQIIYYINIFFFMIVGAVLGGIFFYFIIIFETSLLGAYITMNSFIILFGGYFDDRELEYLIRNEEYDQLKQKRNALVYGYFGLCVLLIFIGIFLGLKRIRCYKRSNKRSNIVIKNIADEDAFDNDYKPIKDNYSNIVIKKIMKMKIYQIKRIMILVIVIVIWETKKSIQ